jgi:hypothetical protein
MRSPTGWEMNIDISTNQIITKYDGVAFDVYVYVSEAGY